MTPSPQGPVLGSFVFHFVFIFSLSHCKEIGLPFWKSQVFHQHSEDVLWGVPHADDFYDIFVGEKAVSSFYSSTIMKVSEN